MKLSGVPKNWDRRTSIIATLGPATSDAKKIRALIDAGADVVRLNFAHGEPDEHARRYEAVRTAERETGRTVAVLQDLAGHKIRVGRLRDGALELRQGQPLVITADEVVGSNGTISTNYPGLPRNVRAGDRILLDDGTLELMVESTAAAAVTTRCVRGGILREHKGINLPGISVDLPAMTDKDVKDLAFGVRLGVDYIALSFVQRAKDVSLARQRDVLCPLHKTQRDVIDPQADAKRQILHILVRHRWEIDGDPGQVDALVLSEDSAADASGGNRGGGRALYHEFEGPVIEQDAVARADVSWEARIVGGDRPVAADNLVGRDDERLSLPQLERAVPQAADPDLVAGEVLQHGHRAAGLALGGPHGFVAAGMLVGLAVREVQPHDVGAGIDQGPDLLCVAGRRAERGDDAGTPVPVLGHTGEFHPKLSMPLRRVKDTSLPILS